MLDIHAEWHDRGHPHQDLYETVIQLKRRHDLHPCSVRPRDGLSLRGDGVREQVQELTARYRKLPEEARRRMPALLNSLAQLEVVVGDFDASQRDFSDVARLVGEPTARADAYHNVFRVALDRRDWANALAALRRAVALDPQMFEPFPFARYEPIQILGAGGFGVSFACLDREAGKRVVVKALRDDTLDRDLSTIFLEAEALQNLINPALPRILNTGFAAPDSARPYMAVEHCDGLPLTEHIAQYGPLTPEEWLDVAWPVVRVLHALHGRGLLHRSLRPACVLVRREQRQGGASRVWVKVLDAGLALKRELIHASASYPDASLQTALGRSVARTTPFAPPEVIGRPKGQVWIGPHSDLYSFGKLCAFGLTGQPHPDRADRLLLPEEWKGLIDHCTGWTIPLRPAHAGLTLDRLAKLPGAEGRIGQLERDLNEAALEGLNAEVEASPGSADAFTNRANALEREGEYLRAISDYTQALRLLPDDPVLYLRRARAHGRQGNLSNALADYTEVLRLDPRNIEALINRGLTLAGRGDHDLAIADFTEALRHAPDVADIYFNRGNAYSARGDHDPAIADYTETIRLDSHHLWALSKRGRAYLVRGEASRAVTDFDRVLQLDPDNQNALSDRATAQLQLGRLDRAIADFSEALRHGVSPELYLERASAHKAAGNLMAAVSDQTSALELAPGHPGVLLARGKSYAGLGQTELALADLDEAARSSPRNWEVRIARGEALLRLRRHTEVITELTQGLAQDGPTLEAYQLRARAFLEVGDLDRAVADFTEALSIDPDNGIMLSCRGQALHRLGDLTLAERDLDAALAIDPSDFTARLLRASTRSHLGKVTEAIDDYTQAIRADPTCVSAYLNRGLLLAACSLLDSAMADFAQAARLQPDNPSPHEHRGRILAELGKLDLAVSALTEAIRLAPDVPGPRYNRALILLEAGQIHEALADLDEVLRLTPAHGQARINRAVARSRGGDESGALDDLNEVIEVGGPETLLARYNRSSILWSAGDDEGALRDLCAILEASPDDVSAFLSRAALHLRRGDHRYALSDLQAAFSRAPDHPVVMNNLAWLYATCPRDELRNADQAVLLARQACAVGEDNPSRFDTLAAALAALGDDVAAAEAQRRAIKLAPEEQREAMNARLALYEAGQAYREMDNQA